LKCFRTTNYALRRNMSLNSDAYNNSNMESIIYLQRSSN